MGLPYRQFVRVAVKKVLEDDCQRNMSHVSLIITSFFFIIFGVQKQVFWQFIVPSHSCAYVSCI